ncbi:MAG: hypothetical protein ACLQDQ_10185 [Myxococcaceae bacterium]
MSELSGRLLVPSVGERGDDPSYERPGHNEDGRNQDEEATPLEPATGYRTDALKSVGGTQLLLGKSMGGQPAFS